jgi:dodecin
MDCLWLEDDTAAIDAVSASHLLESPNWLSTHDEALDHPVQRTAGQYLGMALRKHSGNVFARLPARQTVRHPILKFFNRGDANTEFDQMQSHGIVSLVVPKKEIEMSNVAKVIELTASSANSIEEAVENGIKRADSTLDNVEGAWVQDIKCTVKNGKISEWRVNMKVTFLLK